MDDGLREKNVESGPYRATKLWNNVVHQFRRNMPIGRHRRNMRVYDSCFVSSDAVDWLHEYLLKNQDFGEDVTRYQTIQLLQKFEKAKVIEDVRTIKHHKDPFQDNGRLYRFLLVADSPSKRTPLKNKDNTNTDSSNCRSPQLSIHRKPRGSLNFTPEPRCKKESNLPQCQLIQKSLSRDQIKKVWKTVAIARLQKLLDNISVHDLIDDEDIEPEHIIHNTTFISQNGMVTNIGKEKHLPQWIISAMRCLAHWPNAVEESLPSYPGFEKDVFKVVKDHFQNLDEPLLTYELYDIFYNVFAHADNNCTWRSTPRHPVGIDANSFLSMENLMANMASPKSLSNLNLSCIANVDGSRINHTFSSLQSFNRSEPNFHETMYITARDESYYDNFAFENSSPSIRRYYSSNNLNEAEDYLRNGQDNIAAQKSPTQLAPPRYRDPPPYQAQAPNSSDLNRLRKTLSRTMSYNESLSSIKVNETKVTSKSIETMIELLQVCCLFLPPASRRKLHLLLRLMHKMTYNEQLSLATGMSMRSLVLDTFYRSIFQCIDGSCYDDQAGLKLVAFLMDHHEEIMTVPTRLKQSVESRISDMQRIQIRYDPSTPMNVAAVCQRVSARQYEQKKLNTSEEALYDLLNYIATNEKMPEKEKRRRLKQFQKVYPEIYQKRFPDEGDETVKNRKPLLHGMTGALTKLKAIRF